MSDALGFRARRVRAALCVGALAALGAGAAVMGVLAGAVEIAPADVLAVVRARISGSDPTGVDSVRAAIVWEMRAPRVVLGGLVGACLALAGAMLQGLFRNPLASPDVIGTSAGASLGAVVALSAGLELRSMFYVPLVAIACAFASLFAVLRIARRDGATPVATLLLAGIAWAALVNAANGWLIARAWDDYDVARRISYWMLGGIADRGWAHVAIVAPGALVGAVLAARVARDLDLLAEGEDAASSLGVEVPRATHTVLLAAAVLVGSAVAASGTVAFVGLVVPHLLRLVIGPGHRALLPASAMGGAAFLILADLVARTAYRPGEIHLGIVTASVGAPFFLWLLARQRDESLR